MKDQKNREDFLWKKLPIIEKASLDLFYKEPSIEWKEDGSEVTEGDKAIEKDLRSDITREFPGDGIIGEEFGRQKPSDSDFEWSLDPIDGTVAFARGVPFFGHMVALREKGETKCSWIHYPVFKKTLFAKAGEGTFLIKDWDRSNAEKCQVRKCGKFEKAFVCHSGYEYFRQAEMKDVFNRLTERAHRLRTWGDCFGYFLLVTGRIDLMIDPVFKPWDLLPIELVVKEAGGEYRSLGLDEEGFSSGGVSGCKEMIETAMKELFL
jgi:histidinol phosphatase-like enzyme (inositol monophosphatase family)